ncbi:PfkB family carbohydrate kinase [Pullulanibacillus sp. KACC 23026]|nr:PfkB family carbohydrate kinase [Pullulanibacillus sp. KACC 23026]WEG14958.1 PfkB family carbohydrate kinase [Pullulanibacillus sp. KACC 23026]
MPAHPVYIVDTTGAGDSFNEALAYKLGQGETVMIEAVKYANAAAALSITRIGAQAGMPTSSEVEAFLNRKKWK